MRNIIPIICIAATVLVGCRSSSTVYTQTAVPTVAASPPFQPMFITTPGTNTTPDGTWRIAVSQSDGSLHMTRLYELRGYGWQEAVSVATNPDNWRAQPGWFVFIESQSKVWAYDGDRMLLLDTETPGRIGHGVISGPRRFPCAVPPEVFSRLSEPAQRAIETHE